MHNSSYADGGEVVGDLNQRIKDANDIIFQNFGTASGSSTSSKEEVDDYNPKSNNFFSGKTGQYILYGGAIVAISLIGIFIYKKYTK